MSVSWNQKYNPEEVVNKIEAARIKSGVGEGGVSFTGFSLKEYEVIIYSMLNFSDDIPEVDARGLVFRAIFSAGAKGQITVKRLFSEISRLEREYQALPITQYVLATSISINPSLKFKRIIHEGTSIIFSTSLPKRFQQEIDTLSKNAQSRLFAPLPTNYLKVRVRTSAKSAHHAVNQALEALDFTRGIWNWLLNRGSGFRMTWGGKPEPVNKIILGPMHTIHEINGELADKDVWWYEPSYLGSISVFSPKQSLMGQIDKSFTYLKKIHNTHKYPHVMHNAIVRYTRALDERDWGTAFIKLWSLAELLTDTGRTSYDTTIERIVSLYKDRNYNLQVLRHLRDYRNSSVHLDKSNSEMETYLYQIKGYVEQLIHFHLGRKNRFESMGHAVEFLSLPHDEKTLKAQIDVRNRAKKFRGYK